MTQGSDGFVISQNAIRADSPVVCGFDWRVQVLPVSEKLCLDLVQMDATRYLMDLKGYLVNRGQVAEWIVVWISVHTAVGSNPTAESNCYFRFSQKH